LVIEPRHHDFIAVPLEAVASEIHFFAKGSVNMKRLVTASIALSLGLLVAAMPATLLAEEGISSNSVVRPDAGIRLQDNQRDCNLINFEGIGDNAPIGLVPGPVNVTFGSSWLGLIDGDDGGSGNFANEPSPNTIAYFLDTADISISLVPAVQYVEFYYSAAASSLPITVTGYDSGNNVVDTASGNTIGSAADGANCVGDPNGNYCLWDVISLSTASANIVYVTITGAVANYFGIDNLLFCTVDQPMGACCFDDYSCDNLSAASCAGAGGTWVPNTLCEQANCQAVPTENKTWGTIKSMYR
jgi:hypothetical protein